MFQVSAGWRTSFSGAHAGVLVVRDAFNPPCDADLAGYKEALEEQTRLRFAGQSRSDLEALPILRAYEAYYKRFKKTYHLQLQLESIAFKGKSIPDVAALVEAMFMAEVKNLLLTAGHDLDVLRLPVVLDISSGDETYTLLRGQPQRLKGGDMMMSDGEGIISSVIYGPDQRTQIQVGTQNVMFTVYAPPGISEEVVGTHLQDITGYVRLVAPDARVEMLEVFG